MGYFQSKNLFDKFSYLIFLRRQFSFIFCHGHLTQGDSVDVMTGFEDEDMWASKDESL